MSLLNYWNQYLPQERQAPAQVMPQQHPQLPKILVAGNNIMAPRVQKVAESLNHGLPSWTIVILDQDQWRKWADKNPHASVTDGAFSILGSGRTFISQDWLTKHPDERLQRNLAHELGHLTTNATTEDEADKWADEWLKKLKAKK